MRHDVKRVMNGDDWMGMEEAASDTKDPVRDGDIFLGVILPGGEMLTDTLGHAVAVKSVKSGETLTYYAGSGWSQGGVENMGEWVEEIGAAQAAATQPLTVTVRKEVRNTPGSEPGLSRNTPTKGPEHIRKRPGAHRGDPRSGLPETKTPDTGGVRGFPC